MLTRYRFRHHRKDIVVPCQFLRKRLPPRFVLAIVESIPVLGSPLGNRFAKEIDNPRQRAFCLLWGNRTKMRRGIAKVPKGFEDLFHR